MFSLLSVILSTGEVVSMPGPRSLPGGWVYQGVGIMEGVGIPGDGYTGGGLHQVHPPVLTSTGGHRSRWYASYWKAYLSKVT